MKSQSQDILAKLLSNENITVTRGKVITASFDIKNRVLTLPRWKDMTSTVEEMLMLHEVGHALYTGVADYGVVFKEKAHLKDYANVIEDVRIEKRMKERYPGSRKSFNIGYKELNDRDFFDVKSRELDKLLLIDRINLYFKVGYNCGVKFTSEEQALINRVDLCKTEADVIALAEEIYGFSKAQKEEQYSMPSQIDPNDIDWDNVEFQDVDESDDADGPKIDVPFKPKDPPELSEQTKQEIEKELEAKTVNAFEKNLDRLADDTVEYAYFDLKFEYECDNVIVPYKQVYKELAELIPVDFLAERREKFNKFKADSAPMVNYLIKEFEMRKSATAFKRSKVSRLGQLDPRKLYAYKIKEDLFKQITTVHDGKKHGMVFMLDWSGSMSGYIDETIEQVINLAMFCQRAQIPYQVFAFTDGYKSDERYEQMSRDHYDDKHKKIVNKNGIDTQLSFNLLELFSNRMTGSDFNKQVELMLARPYKRSHYKLNGTPLNQALLYMVDYVGEFKRNNQVEKLSFITLTDGESNSLVSYSRGIKNGRSYIYDDNSYGRAANVKSFAHDHITKKDYELSSDQALQTSMLLNVIRDRYDANSIGFFIMEANGRSASSFIRHNMPNLRTGLAYTIREKIVTGLRKEKFVIMDDVPGRDEYYIIPSDQRIEEFHLDNVSTDMNAATISRQLTKAMNTRKHSRVVLNSFIGQVA